MNILISELPKSDWWGLGMPHYKNNWLMAEGNIPRPDIVRDAHARLVSALEKVVPLTRIPFPEQFDTPQTYKHDFIFVRDSYIAVAADTAVISNFSERQRQDEAHFMQTYLKDRVKRMYTLPSGAYAEGGEFQILHKDRIMFAGINRNNKRGIEEISRLSGIEDICIVKTGAFHLDTNVSVLLNREGNCIGVIAAMSQIQNAREVSDFCSTHRLDLFAIDPIDGMGGPDEPGTLAANALALPGVLIGCAHFMTPGLEEKIVHAGIEHVVVPLYDLKFSGGSVHCLTNELGV